MTSISEIRLKATAPLPRGKCILYLSNGDFPSVDRYIRKKNDGLSKADVECQKKSDCKEIRFSKRTRTTCDEEQLDPKTRAILSEIKLDHLSKALFFLYLKHPEGIRYKELMNYRNELLDLYLNITGKDNLEEIHKSINDLVYPMQNAINVKVSRVKSAFKSAVSDRVAKFYYIDGMSGESKKIHLDRDYVIWEK